MSQYCQCDNPRYSHHIEGGRKLCLNCGKPEFVQFSKKSEKGKYTGTVEVGARGYFILLSDGDVSHRLTQKKVKQAEESTGLTGQALADFIASRTTAIRSDYNGKYGTSSATFDLRSDEEKKAAAERQAIYDAECEAADQARAAAKNKAFADNQGTLNIVVECPLSLSYGSREKIRNALKAFPPSKIGKSSNSAILITDPIIKSCIRNIARFFCAKLENPKIKKIELKITIPKNKEEYTANGLLIFDKVSKLIENYEIEEWNEEESVAAYIAEQLFIKNQK